jgi:signal peptidase II
MRTRRKNTPGKKEGNADSSREYLPVKYAFTIILLLVGAALLFLDQFLKHFFGSHSYYFGWISFHEVTNTGISFGLLQGMTLVMILVSIVFLFLIWYYRKEFKGCYLCLMFLTVGTLGNLIDRVFYGYVVDFVDLGWFPVFNVSDALITIGVAGLILLFAREIWAERKGRKRKRN